MRLASSETPALLSASHFVLFPLVHSAVVHCHKALMLSSRGCWSSRLPAPTYCLIFCGRRSSLFSVLSFFLSFLVRLLFSPTQDSQSWSSLISFPALPVFSFVLNIFICRQVCYFSLSKFSVVLLLLPFSMLFSGTFLAGSGWGSVPGASVWIRYVQ